MISNQTTQEVRSRASIVEVVSDYVTLKKAGQNYSGLCPFHSEKSPSFSVNEEKGVFYCFGCQAGGDVFKFLMLYDGLTFPESIERLAARYGIPVEVSESGDGSKRRSSAASATGRCPGRVDSAPMSRKSAPSPSKRKACSTAASTSPFKPSPEKESGVTLITPIT